MQIIYPVIENDTVNIFSIKFLQRSLLSALLFVILLVNSEQNIIYALQQKYLSVDILFKL